MAWRFNRRIPESFSKTKWTYNIPITLYTYFFTLWWKHEYINKEWLIEGTFSQSEQLSRRIMYTIHLKKTTLIPCRPPALSLCLGEPDQFIAKFPTICPEGSTQSRFYIGQYCLLK